MSSMSRHSRAKQPARKVHQAGAPSTSAQAGKGGRVARGDSEKSIVARQATWPSRRHPARALHRARVIQAA